MTISLQIKTAAEADNLIREAEQHQAKEREAASEQSKQISTNIPTAHNISILDGRTTARSNGAVLVETERPLPVGFCRLSNGWVEDLQSVKAANLTHMIVEMAGDDAGPFELTPSLRPREIENLANTEERGVEEKKDDKGQKLEGATPEEQQQVTKAHETLNAAREALGSFAVESIQGDVVASGELPSADDLPDGISSEMVQNVADAYVAQANTVLRAVPGANVETLTEMLNESELKEARLAVFTANDDQLKNLAYKAMSRLQKLPDDPASLKQLTANWPDTHRVVQRDGQWFVVAPHAEALWSDLVASGEIRFA